MSVEVCADCVGKDEALSAKRPRGRPRKQGQGHAERRTTKGKKR
ncbi:MAG TPA: hypothetical protein VKD72_00945 [Gemmataceae bacterium]|nr:hypothetical protein [Gemmataceae bacterium]